MAREPFPWGLSVASIGMTALGLSAAALGIKWGAAPPAGDALAAAWLYVQVMWMLMWLVVWPAVALRSAPRPAPGTPLWEWAAIVIGALPAAAVAAFLSGVTPRMAALMLALQLAAGLLMLGVMRLRSPVPAGAATLAGLAATLTLAGPVAAFLWTEFFPQGSHGWFLTLPLIAVGHAARMSPTDIALVPSLWGIAGTYSLLGLLLLLAGTRQKKAPGIHMPRA